MKFRTWTLGSIFSLVFVLLVATATVHAAPIIVNCSKGGSIGSTLASLAKDGNTRAITISVSGTCKENIVITAFDHLRLQAVSGATTATTLQDASNGALPVVEILNSYDVTLIGFAINGGSSGLLCHQRSYCSLYTNIIQQSGDGASFLGSQGIVTGNKILNNAGVGVRLNNGSNVTTISNTVSGNGDDGMRVISGSNLSAHGDTIDENMIGIRVAKNSVLRANDMTITGNSSAGVFLAEASTASFEQAVTGNVINGNGGNGVAVNDLSFAAFIDSNNVSGNLTQPDVACNPQYSATRGAFTIGGTTNCLEPRQKK